MALIVARYDLPAYINMLISHTQTLTSTRPLQLLSNHGPDLMTDMWVRQFLAVRGVGEMYDLECSRGGSDSIPNETLGTKRAE